MNSNGSTRRGGAASRHGRPASPRRRRPRGDADDWELRAMRADLKAARMDLVGEGLRLDPPLARIFWPIYRDYEAELSALGEARAALARRYFERLSRALGPALAARFLELERRLELVTELP